MATSGTDRSSIAIGMKANSSGLTMTNSPAITMATTMPVMNPIAASARVVSQACSSSVRAASAVSERSRTPRAGLSVNR